MSPWLLDCVHPNPLPKFIGSNDYGAMDDDETGKM